MGNGWIFPIRKLRHSEAKSLTQGHTTGRCRTWTQFGGLQFPDLNFASGGAAQTLQGFSSLWKSVKFVHSLIHQVTSTAQRPGAMLLSNDSVVMAPSAGVAAPVLTPWALSPSLHYPAQIFTLGYVSADNSSSLRAVTQPFLPRALAPCHHAMSSGACHSCSFSDGWPGPP